ncbi:ABC transporter permease subunit [Terrilactibacillus sp. S3-3]|nr:ABC transporter permease subunit [Terrilactibacillus sp. S3-3]
MIMICAFALMISTLLKSSALAIALSIVIEFAGSIVSNLLALWGKDYAKYLFFNNTDLYQYVEGEPLSKGMTVGFSLSVLVVYFILFMAVSLFVFEKRDITS